MKSSQILSFALAFASLSSASLLDKPEFSDALAGFEGFFRRQDDSDKSATTSAPPSSSTSSDNKDNKDSSASASDQASNSATGKGSSATASGSGKNSASGGTKTTSKPKTTAFDPRLPAGGVSMITPAAISGPQYYKIGDWVTFAWNYTSLSVTPTAIDVLATCTKNQATYTLAVNQTVGNSTGYVLWDTGAYQSTATVPLLTETYTLLIFDADSSVSATAAAGYLAVQSGHSFGMYTPQPYTPWADYRCPTCNSGSTLSATERQTLGFLFAMGTITVLSFTWFANGFGLF